jgi:hypothetical protein
MFMKTYGIAVVASAMLVVAFIGSVFPQKKESNHHRRMIMKGQRGLRPHFPGSLKEEEFCDNQIPGLSIAFGRGRAKSLSDTMYIEISVVAETWDTSANAWRVYYKDVLAYDAHGRETADVGQEWNGNGWLNEWRDTYAYDANGNETENLKQSWSYSGSAWVNYDRDSYTYDANGNATEDVYQTWNDSTWVNYDRDSYTYDAHGNTTEHVYRTWIDSAWVNDLDWTYAYDANRKETEELGRNWNGSAWVNWSDATLTYDANGNRTEVLGLTWNDSGWVNSQEYTWAYDASGQDTADVGKMWISNVWANWSKYTHAYDASGKDTADVYEYGDGSSWVNGYYIIYTYDDNGNETERLYRQWNGRAWENQDKKTYIWRMLVADVHEKAHAASSFALSANYPNPFNPQTTISFSLPKESYVTLKVYDLLGREVATLAKGKKEAGEYAVAWNAGSAPSGIYFYRLEAVSTAGPSKSFMQAKKMLLMK